MKRKDTTIIIVSDISTLGFSKDHFKEDMEKLAMDITYYADNVYARWNFSLKNITINSTSLEDRKIVRFIYTINSGRHDSNYENSISMKMCLNLQKVFDKVNLLNEKAHCFIDSLYNSRLAK